MRPLKIYTDFPFEDLERLPRFVERADSAGYTGVFATENRHDPFLPIAAVARPHSHIDLGTAVVSLLARSPFTVAQTSWDLHFNCGERFILGVGTQTDEHLRWRFGIDCDDKHGRFREAILAVRELWASWIEDRPPTVKGLYYNIDSCPASFRPTTRINTLPRIYVLCTTMSDLEIAADIADGIFVHPMWHKEFLDRIVCPHLPVVVEDKRFEVISGGFIIVGDSKPERQIARRHVQQQLTKYIMSGRHAHVFVSLTHQRLLESFLERMSSEFDPWGSSTGEELLEMFACDTTLDDLPSALPQHLSERVSGVFPNVTSIVRRLLPPEHVHEIVNGTDGRG